MVLLANYMSIDNELKSSRVRCLMQRRLFCGKETHPDFHWFKQFAGKKHWAELKSQWYCIWKRKIAQSLINLIPVAFVATLGVDWRRPCRTTQEVPVLTDLCVRGRSGGVARPLVRQFHNLYVLINFAIPPLSQTCSPLQTNWWLPFVSRNLISNLLFCFEMKWANGEGIMSLLQRVSLAPVRFGRKR